MIKLAEFIEKNDQVLIKKNVVTSADLTSAESELGFSFDSDYAEYLLKYGKITYESMELYGLGVPDKSYLNVVSATKNLVSKFTNWPSNAVVLEDLAEDNYIVYVMNAGVFQFAPIECEKVSNSLEEYIMMRVDEV
jgi:hypothetical protein